MYLGSLESVESISFDESVLEEPVSDAEKCNDKEFLVYLGYLLKGNYIEFPIPALAKQVERARICQDFQVYSAETYSEFNRLLLRLLKLLCEALRVLSVTDPKTVPTKTAHQTLVAAMLCGLALQKLTQGSALRMHLKNIQSLLQCNPVVHTKSWSVPIEQEGDGREAEDEGFKADEGRDEELEAVDPSVDGDQEDVWEFYLKWFRLLLVHFQAAFILTKYVTGDHLKFRSDSDSRVPISIRILAPPYVDDKLLPWRDLFTNDNLFPSTSSSNVGSGERSNAEILEFLEKGMKDIPKWTSAIEGAKKAWAANKVDETIEQIQLLGKAPLPGWDTTAKNLLRMLQQPTKEQFTSVITDTIYALSESTWLFTFLNSKDNKFKGALHCEASLASLISHSGDRADWDADSKCADLLMTVNVIICFQLVLAIRYLYIHRVLDQLLGYPNLAARHVKDSCKF